MRVPRPSRTVAACLLATCLACTDVTQPVAPAPSTRAAAPLLRRGAEPIARDREMLKLADAIAGFGGLYLTDVTPKGRRPGRGGGRTVIAHVYVTDDGSPGQAKKTIAQALTARGYTVERVDIRHATHDFHQIVKWRDSAARAVRGLGLGPVMLAASPRLNGIWLGFVSADAQSRGLAALKRHKVPQGMVHSEVRGALLPASDTALTARFNPMPGGISIGVNLAGSSTARACTLGFNTNMGGMLAFLTASHCSAVVNQTDASQARQPVGGGLIIGHEYYDAPADTYGCPYAGYPCRWSDASIFSYDANFAQHGYLAYAYYQSPVAVANQRTRLDGRVTDYYAGDLIDKVGAATGLTEGTVQNPCADVLDYQPTPGVVYDLICQLDVGMYVDGGDSGAPAFYWYGADGALLAGLVVARDPTHSYATISRLDGIEYDLGSIGTFTPYF